MVLASSHYGVYGLLTPRRVTSTGCPTRPRCLNMPFLRAPTALRRTPRSRPRATGPSHRLPGAHPGRLARCADPLVPCGPCPLPRPFGLHRHERPSCRRRRRLQVSADGRAGACQPPGGRRGTHTTTSCHAARRGSRGRPAASSPGLAEEEGVRPDGQPPGTRPAAPTGPARGPLGGARVAAPGDAGAGGAGVQGRPAAGPGVLLPPADAAADALDQHHDQEPGAAGPASCSRSAGRLCRPASGR